VGLPVPVEAPARGPSAAAAGVTPQPAGPVQSGLLPQRKAPAASPRVAATAPSAPVAVPSAPHAEVAEVAPRSLTSLRVVHQHRLGNCRGQLVVNRDGVAYIPEDDGPGKDGFRLKYTQFLDQLSGASLRITSNDRDYRFKVAAPSAHDREQLEQLVAAIARFR
jgi:hypothetical protein